MLFCICSEFYIYNFQKKKKMPAVCRRPSYNGYIYSSYNHPTTFQCFLFLPTMKLFLNMNTTGYLTTWGKNISLVHFVRVLAVSLSKMFLYTQTLSSIITRPCLFKEIMKTVPVNVMEQTAWDKTKDELMLETHYSVGLWSNTEKRRHVANTDTKRRWVISLVVYVQCYHGVIGKTGGCVTGLLIGGNTSWLCHPYIQRHASCDDKNILSKWQFYDSKKF